MAGLLNFGIFSLSDVGTGNSSSFGGVFGASTLGGWGSNAYFVDNISQTMLQVVAQLQNNNVVGPNSVVFSLLEDPFPAAGFPQVVVTPGAFRPLESQFDGGGRYTMGLYGSVALMVWIRSASDVAYQDIVKLTDISRGAYILVNRVINVMQEFFAYDPQTGGLLTEEGFKLTDVGEPKRGNKPKGVDGKSSEIVGIRLQFETRLAMTLDTSSTDPTAT